MTLQLNNTALDLGLGPKNGRRHAEHNLSISVKKVIEVLRLLHEHEKLSMLIAEQNVSFLDFAEKIYILDKGQVTFGGDVEQLKGNDTIRETYFGISH